MKKLKNTNFEFASQAIDWVAKDALPLWLERGVDWKRGGFYESLTLDTAENTVDFKRLRVVTRQIYVFSAAKRMGITDADRGLQHGLEFLLGPARHLEGGFSNRFNLDGETIDATRDLYDLAFVCFALAHAYDVTKDPELKCEALDLLTFVQTQMQHPNGGFHEALPNKQPRRQNPHMHFLEAALAWAKLDPKSEFSALASSLANLFKKRLFNAESGCLPEYFDDHLNNLPGTRGAVTEPGHHFEWVWLLHHARKQELFNSDDEASALYKFAHRYGVSDDTNMPFGQVSTVGQVVTADTRLWTLTEWLKAEVVIDETERDVRIKRAFTSMMQFLATPIKGLWYEHWIAKNNRFQSAPSSATSLYHLVLAIETLATEEGILPSPFAY